jgi:cell division protein FtsQ
MSFSQSNKIRPHRFSGNDFLQNAETMTLASLKNTRLSSANEENRFRRFCTSAWIMYKRVTLTFVYTILWYGLQIVAEDIIAVQQSSLKIQHVEIQNNLLVSKEEVLQAIKVRSSESWLTCDLKKIREAVETLPNVKSAVVQKIFPGLLRIRLQERFPVFCMRVGGELLDAEGNKILLKNGFQAYPNLPRISGISLSDSGIISSELKSLYQTQVTLLNAFQKQFEKKMDEKKFGMVTEVLVLPSSTELRLTNGLVLRFPNQQPVSLFPRLSKVLDDLIRKGVVAKMIDMQYRDVFVTVG